MPPTTAGPARRRREGLVLLGLAAVAAIVFTATPLDLAASRAFYHPDRPDPWSGSSWLPWALLYRAAPWITASLVLLGLLATAYGALRNRDAPRRNGAFLLLAIVVGPGLLVNFVLKDHWGRPRPRDVVEFGGAAPYVAPLVPSREGGTSFPCGHCSAGFLLAAGWWVWRRQRPSWARASLAAGLGTGFALGLGRMAAGGHFLSDVVASGLLALGVAHVLHDHVLRVEDAEPPRPAPAARARLQSAWAALAAAGGVLVLLALFATPHGASIAARIPLARSPRPPWTLEVSAQRANIDLLLVDEAPEIVVDGELHGFGLPTSTLATKVDVVDAARPIVRFRIVQTGWFTDLDGAARLRVPVEALERVTVRVDRGNIRVIDRTRSAGGALPALDLRTGYGQVLPPRAPGVRTSP